MVALHSGQGRLPSTRRLAWIVSKEAATLPPDDAAILACMRADSETDTVHLLACSYVRMICEKRSGCLDGWRRASPLWCSSRSAWSPPNRGRCPLTPVAARYTADRCDNINIYLLVRLARYNKHIFGALYVAGTVYALARWARASS